MSSARRAKDEDLNAKIHRAMTFTGLSIGDLRDKLNLSYEHARRIAKGEAVPGPDLTPRLAELLNLDAEAVESAAAIERVRKKVPGVWVGTAVAEDMSVVVRLWPQLTAEQKSDITHLVQRWTQRNRMKE